MFVSVDINIIPGHERKTKGTKYVGKVIISWPVGIQIDRGGLGPWVAHAITSYFSGKQKIYIKPRLDYLFIITESMLPKFEFWRTFSLASEASFVY